ncbi:bifunctional salicylyl-CoA 5-hydroxylase/oxidoreductase [Microbacterium sp. ZXX196]|uniref:bifunctional salicylyl-CoA 5-hydroxylase/oxidoreductase n=1 Tax=Microbacterium sp. ZXX196 TaxID=2609291 RepID=UPI001327861F|nr:bifunctional salicylyl-CoA 5-hydroxylase/oxidoreductase [Microbacterium sp. ZXX196]
MRVAVIGGGPGGLYAATLMKELDPTREVEVWERKAPDDTYGFGVVFSDETIAGIRGSDPRTLDLMTREMAQWSDIDIRYRGEDITVGGQGFSALGRRRLLQILQQRCADLGVVVHYRTLAPDVEQLAAEYDLVVAADGLRSPTRERWSDYFGARLDRRRSKYIWLGTDLVFEAFTFIIKHTPWGVMQMHGYPYSVDESTFIVEMEPEVWERAGFGRTAGLGPGDTDEDAVARIAEIFREDLGGHALRANNSQWLEFTTVRTETWHRDNVVLIGDAAHTAHFSIGSGTKLALEDALALAAALHENPDMPSALSAYDAERRPVVASTQRAAQASLEWFEDIAQYAEQEPWQFAFNLLTRSRRITRDGLRPRDPDFAERTDRAFAAAVPAGRAAPAMFQPIRIGGLDVDNRIAVAPMDMYSARDGVANDFHLVHLGSKAAGGAGLVLTEMIAPSADGRITLGCTGLYTDEQARAYRRITDYVHAQSSARIGAQLGHSGRKGSTRLMWEGIDEPLTEGGWETMGPSSVPYKVGVSVAPREMTRRDMDAVVADYASAARRAADAGFDLVEVHAAHGYLLSSFLSPLSNRRTDAYGGSAENRLRFPLEVFDAVREAFGEAGPVTVRLSAVDWAPGGNEVDDAVRIAEAFIDHGAAAIHVSSGQVVGEEAPAFGRSYQAPFADAIRNRVAAARGVPVIAVGAISSYDDVNSLLLAGRADMCALGRTHLYDPQWTLHAAADQDYRGPGAAWPAPFRAGQRKPPTGRTDAVRPRLELVRGRAEAPRATRWHPLASALV